MTVRTVPTDRTYLQPPEQEGEATDVIRKPRPDAAASELATDVRDLVSLRPATQHPDRSLVPSGLTKPTAEQNTVGPRASISARDPSYDARLQQAIAQPTDAARMRALLDLANDPSLSPAERAQAFVAAGRVAATIGGEDGTVKAELYYLSALRLDPQADQNIPGARLLHISILHHQDRRADMLPLLQAEILANQPPTPENRPLLMRLHRTLATVHRTSARMQESLAAIDEAIALASAQGIGNREPTMMRLQMRRARILRIYGAQLRENGTDPVQGRALQRESTQVLQDIWHYLRDNPSALPTDRQNLLHAVHGLLAERVSPRFVGNVRQPDPPRVTAADITTIENKFNQAQTLYNQAVGRPASEASLARQELAQVRQLAEEILGLDDNDGMAHFLWAEAQNAEDNLSTPLIGPLDTQAERQAVLGQLRNLAGQAQVGTPPTAGQPDVALRQLFPEWDQLSETQRAAVAYQILGYGALIPQVIEQGATYRFAGVGTSAAIIDPSTQPDEFDQEDRAFYAGRGWAYPTGGGGHFIVTGVEDILAGARGGYATVSHEFAHLVHGVLRRARTRATQLRAAGQPVPPEIARMEQQADRIDAEYQRVQSGTGTPPEEFLNSYAARNPSEFFAEAMRCVLTGGDDMPSRRLFSRNPSMWQFARSLMREPSATPPGYSAFPPNYEHGLDRPALGLNATGRPTTLARLGRSSSNPHLRGAANAGLAHLQALHNPQHPPQAPPLTAPSAIIGDPSQVTYAPARQLIAQVNAGDFAAARQTAETLRTEIESGKLTDEQTRAVITALSVGLVRAEEKAEWRARDTFLTVLLTLFTLIGGLIYALLRAKDAKALKQILGQKPVRERTEADWRQSGIELAGRGGESLANLRATGGEAAVQTHLEQELRAIGFDPAEATERALWMLEGVREATRLGLTAAPSPYPGAPSLTDSERQQRTNVLLDRAGQLAEIDAGSRPLNSLGETVDRSVTPPVWSFSAGDTAIQQMSLPELEAQTRLELAQIDRELAQTGLSPARRSALQAARAELQTLQADLRQARQAFHGNPSATPPTPPSRPPEELASALQSLRQRLVPLHRTVLGPVP